MTNCKLTCELFGGKIEILSWPILWSSIWRINQNQLLLILRSLVEGMKERINSLKQDFDTLNHLRLQNYILAQAVPVAAVPAPVEIQDLETIRALRDGLVAAYNSLLAQGGQAAAQHLDLAGPGGLNVRGLMTLIGALTNKFGQRGHPAAVNLGLAG